MVDDIADSIHNKEKGKVFNEPNGPDVYGGVVKDYTKSEVSPKNFLKILNGEKPEGGSGKVIASGPNDRVFVYFADHGASVHSSSRFFFGLICHLFLFSVCLQGLIAFPTTLGIFEHFLYADVRVFHSFPVGYESFVSLAVSLCLSLFSLALLFVCFSFHTFFLFAFYVHTV